MSNNTASPPIAWATVAARRLKAKVPEPIRMVRDSEVRETLVAHSLYEDTDIKHHLLAQKVYSVMQNALSPGSVLFSFPGNLFDHRSDAYQLVLDQIGPVVGGDFKPVSQFGNRIKNELLFSVVFRDSEHAEKAISSGVSYNEVVYKGTPFKDGVQSRLVRVHMHLPVTEEEDILTEYLLKSMGHYGKVCDVKKYKSRGFYEGQVSVLLDLTAIDGKEYQPLSKMVYLESWDVLVPASYRGAPPVCYHCRQAGHIRKDCPTLKAIECFRCHMKGHTARFCKKEVASLSEEIDNYIADTEEKNNRKAGASGIPAEKQPEEKKPEVKKPEVKEPEVRKPEVTVVKVELAKAKSIVPAGIAPMLLDPKEEASSNAEVVDEHMSDGEEVVLVQLKKKVIRKEADGHSSFVGGTAASNFASSDVKSTMTVDSPKEMLGISTLKKDTQQRLASLKQNTKVPVVPGGNSSISRLSNTRKGS